VKAVRFERFGPPDVVARCVDQPDPEAPGDGEALVAVEAFPINPVDQLTIAGAYAVRPPLPATPGSEGVGRVLALGAGVDGFAPGDRVLLLGRGTWAQRLKVKASELLKLPGEGDVLQFAMLKINPATARLMLSDFVALAPGDWVIQDAANSGVGRLLIQLARAEGLRTVNVVRRAELAPELEAIGGDAVLVDGPDLAERAAEATGGAAIRLAIDAVAGETCNHLAQCLAEGGTIVNYGLLSGRACAVDPFQVVFRGITLTGFWLVKALGARTVEARAALYADLAARLASGALRVPVEASYPIEEIGAALAHAAREARGGKILVTPNGPPASA